MNTVKELFTGLIFLALWIHFPMFWIMGIISAVNNNETAWAIICGVIPPLGYLNGWISLF